MLQADVATLLPGVDPGSIDAIEPIKHGLTNESWLVRTRQDAIVVRLSNTSETSLQIDRSSEALVLQTVARADIGPQVICSDPARHVLVTRYAGPTWSGSEAVQTHNIVRIAALLRRLHALAVPAGVRVVDLRNTIDGYLRTLDTSGVRCAATTTALRAQAAQVAATLQHQSSACLCHNDIHALNVVDDGTLRLIDWEYAGLGERFFDLASICVYHDYDRTQREQLLASYTREQEPQAWHRLELCCWLFDYIRDLWMAVRQLTDDR
jgi:thiamine kinase